MASSSPKHSGQVSLLVSAPKLPRQLPQVLQSHFQVVQGEASPAVQEVSQAAVRAVQAEALQVVLEVGALQEVEGASGYKV